MRLFAILVALLFASTSTDANPVPPPTPMFVSNGMLCNEEAEVISLLTDIALVAPEMPESIPAGCGMFVPRAPMQMVVTPLYWYDTPLASVLVGRFVTADGSWTQYGWVAYIPNPEYKPSSKL